MLGLDEAACTACGLCQAVCPQNAISIVYEPPVRGDEVLLVCEKTGAEYGRQRISCLHQVGMEQLAKYYQQGVRKLIVASADCKTCIAPGRLLEKHLQEFNLLACNRELSPIEMIVGPCVPDKKWCQADEELELEDSSKRKLFTALGKHLSDNNNEPAEDAPASQHAKFQSRNASPKTTIFSWVPRINEDRCDGCDACMRICPAHSLTRVNENGSQTHYEILPQNCNGCELCLDVCQNDAIILSEMDVCKTRIVPLQAFTCTSCGVACHVPGSETKEDSLCRICSQTQHHKKLFQVLT